MFKAIIEASVRFRWFIVLATTLVAAWGLFQLTKLPIDILKIDRSFIQHCGHDGNSATVVSAIINLADQLGHSVVAEGVETVAQLAFLRERRCSRIQGYLVGKPVPLHTFVAQLDRWRKIAVALANPII